MNNRFDKPVARAREIVSGFTPGQRAVVVVGALALLLGAVALTRWVSQPQWSPLYGNLSGQDANAIVEQLQAAGVQYRLADGGSTVLVPRASVYEQRVALSGKGLPTGESSGGYSVLDKQGITATDFQQSVAYRRALEGELDKTLQAIDGVNTAVVHLALPKKDVFATEQDRPTASVLLALAPGQELSREQVKSVTHLVAGSVEGLDAARVTVTDSRGTLLSGPDGAGGGGAAGDADKQTSQFEQRVGGNAQQMLDKVLGAGRAVVNVSADLNYDNSDTTSERYTYPDEVPPLSETESQESYGAQGTGVGGALGQTWPTLTPVTGQGGDGYYLKQQRTRDNSVDKIVSRTRTAPGQVRRLSVAVVLDSATVGGVDPLQVEALVGNAVGLDAERGDTITVSQMPFDTTSAAEARKELEAAAKAESTQRYMDLGQKALIGLVLFIALMIALARRRRNRARGTTVQATAHDLPDYPQEVLIPAPAQSALSATPEEPDEDEAERIHMREHIAELVENQPEEVAAVIQGWLAERNA